MIEKGKRIVSVRNVRGIKIKKCCASCIFKDYLIDGTRICLLHGEQPVESRDRCRHWQMSDGMKNAGRRTGVVRDIITKEVIIL